NDAARHRAIETERIADNDRRLAYLQIMRGSKWDGNQFVLGCVNAQHGQILVGVNPDSLRIVGGAVRENDLDGAGALDHVVVGDDVAVLIPHETRTRSPGNAL